MHDDADADADDADADDADADDAVEDDRRQTHGNSLLAFGQIS